MIPDAQAFAAAWIDAWNRHDLEDILSHYAPEIVFVSPAAPRITGDPSGRVVGKAALAKYWRAALEAVPDLRFELVSVLRGAEGLALRYRSSRTGREVVEVLSFDASGLAVAAAAYYE